MAASAIGKLQITLSRLFWWVFIAALVSGYIRIACFSHWQAGRIGVSIFAGVVAIIVGLIATWEPFALRGALIFRSPSIAIGYLMRSQIEETASTANWRDHVVAICATVGIVLAYFGSCIALHVRGHLRTSTWLLLAPFVAYFVVSISINLYFQFFHP